MLSKRWKDELNKTMLLFSRTLEPEEWEVWRGFLEPLPDGEIVYAFENWQRNGRFFPKPKDILDQVEVYRNGRLPKGNTYCDNECKSRHDRGYHENDMLWLYKRMVKEIQGNRQVNAGALLRELDSKREGGAPAWRR